MRERMDAGQEGGKARRRQSWGETGQGRQDWGDRTGWMQVNVGEDVCCTGSMQTGGMQDQKDAEQFDLIVLCRTEFWQQQLSSVILLLMLVFKWPAFFRLKNNCFISFALQCLLFRLKFSLFHIKLKSIVFACMRKSENDDVPLIKRIKDGVPEPGSSPLQDKGRCT